MRPFAPTAKCGVDSECVLGGLAQICKSRQERVADCLLAALHYVNSHVFGIRQLFYFYSIFRQLGLKESSFEFFLFTDHASVGAHWLDLCSFWRIMVAMKSDVLLKTAWLANLARWLKCADGWCLSVQHSFEQRSPCCCEHLECLLTAGCRALVGMQQDGQATVGPIDIIPAKTMGTECCVSLRFLHSS